MRVLLDSQTLLWWVSDSEQLGPKARKLIVDSQSAFVSMATFWELGIKINLGKLKVPGPLEDVLSGTGFELLGLTIEHVLAGPRLPVVHRDPFDRLLVAQAQIERLTIITTDSFIPAYDVKTLDAAT